MIRGLLLRKEHIIVRTTLLFTAIALLLALTPPACATDYHGDWAPSWLINDNGGTTWWDIIEDHDEGFCDNTSSTGQGFRDVDCFEYSTGTPRSTNQDCGTGSCEVSATVYCPYLGNYNAPGSTPYNDWFTFTCSGSATDGVRAGILSTNPTKKGVQCGAVECGCVYTCPPGGYTFPNGYHVSCTFQFFGNMYLIGGNFNNRQCG